MADELSNEIVALCDEAGLLPGRDALLNAGVSPMQVRDMAATILNADTVEQAQSTINEQVEAVELQDYIEQLPEAGRRAEIEVMAKAWHIPPGHVEWCLEKAELYDNLMGRDNPFIRR